MAQYNLVGYNAAPTNPEYDITSQGLSQIPRTNWAEYSLKKEEMRENKKLNRIKTAVDTAGKIASIAATGVDMYQTIDQMDLKKESLKLDNNLKSLDIQSKTIDVSNKADQAAKDLAYTNKIRELQTAQDWTGLGALVMSDIETAQRNSGVTKSIIEQLKFNKFNQADQLFATIFPDEQYKRDQDTLNRQQAFALKSMEVNSPLHQAQANYYNMLAKEKEFAMNGGVSSTDMKKLNEQTVKDFSSAQVTIDSNGNLNGLYTDNNIPSFEYNIKNGGDIEVENLENVQELLQEYAKLNSIGKLDQYPQENLSILKAVFGDTIPTENNWDTKVIEEEVGKNRLLKTTLSNGVTKYMLVTPQEAKSLMTAKNSYLKQLSMIAPNKFTISYKGDLSQMTSAEMQALSGMAPAILAGYEKQYPNFLNTATPQQQTTNGYKALLNAVTRATGNGYTEQVASSNYVQGEPAQTPSNLKTVLDTAIKQDPSNDTKTAKSVASRVDDKTLDAMAKIGSKLTGITYTDDMSKSEKEGLATIAIKKEIEEERIAENNKSEKEITESIKKEPVERKIQGALAEQIHLDSNENFETSLNKLKQENLDKSKKLKTNKEIMSEYTTREIESLSNELGKLLDQYNITVGSADIRRIRLNSSAAVKNFVNREYSIINGKNEFRKRSLPKDHTENNLREDLIDFIQEAIDKIKRIENK